MATIRPFRAIRPSILKAEAVAALPYDVMNSEEARLMAADKPDSFLHVDKAEIDLPIETDHYDSIVYEKARENLERMRHDKTLIQDDEPMLYIYKLTMDGHSQTGLVATTSIDEYLDETIKKHELTRAEKEADRIRHVDVLNANTGPIFLAYKSNQDAKKLLAKWTADHPAVYDFLAEDGILHQAWLIDDTQVIEKLIMIFKQVNNLYIADGHHRNASAVKVGQSRRLEHPGFTGDEEFNYYLSVLFDSSELRIFDYNRVVKDLNGLTPDELVTQLSKKFIVLPYEKEGCCRPEKRHQFGMYIDEKWYVLTAKDEIISSDPVAGLDVAILQKEVLEEIFHISDPRTDARIDFVGGIRGLKELEKRVDSGEMSVAFSMYPTSMDELMAVADKGLCMPPKSTWFEPKLRSGLFIHEL